MTNSIKITRRNLLGATAGLMAAAGLNPTSAWAQAASPAAAPAGSTGKPLPSYVSWKNAESMIVHTPTTIETVPIRLSPLLYYMLRWCRRSAHHR